MMVQHMRHTMIQNEKEKARLKREAHAAVILRAIFFSLNSSGICNIKKNIISIVRNGKTLKEFEL